MMHTALLVLILTLGGGVFHPGGLLDLAATAWAGNHADPNGEAATSDAGNHFDPNGVRATGDAGGIYDPNGLTGDAGGSYDPNG
jgi:hypothetical protein